MNLPSGPGPEGYPAVLAHWRAAWRALRVHTGRDISEINSIHIVNDHLEVKQLILIHVYFSRHSHLDHSVSLEITFLL